MQTKKLHGPILSSLLSLFLLLLIQPARLAGIFSHLVNPNTDNDGTFWWLIDRCKAPLHPMMPRELESVAWNAGYDIRPIPFWNLYDQFRILLLKIVECNPYTSIAIVNVLHLLMFLATVAAIHCLMKRLVHSDNFASVGTVVFVVINFIDNSRMQMSLSVPLFGVLALSTVLAHYETVDRSYASRIFGLMLLQTLVNAYWGLFTLLTVGLMMIVLYDVSEFRSRRTRKLFVSTLTGVVTGLIPLIPSQLVLLSNRNQLSVVRPLDFNKDLLNPWILFSRPANFLGLGKLIDETGTGPRISWLSVGLIVLLVVGLATISLQSDVASRQWRRLIVLTLLLSIFYFRYPVTSVGVEFLLEKLAFIRAISLLQFYFFIFISAAAVLVLKHVLTVRPRNSVLAFAVVSALVLHVFEQSLAQMNQTSTINLSSVIGDWQKLAEKLDERPVAHYPDKYDDFSELDFGLPNRVIEFAQIGHERVLVNGRDQDDFLMGCGRLPELNSEAAIRSLAEIGTGTIVLHRQLMSASQFSRAVSALSKSPGVRYLGNITAPDRLQLLSESSSPYMKALDAEVFVLPRGSDGSPEKNCRFALSTGMTAVTTEVNGSVYGAETDGSGNYWWHTGDRGLVTVVLKPVSPLLNRKLFLRIDKSPCLDDVRLRVTRLDSSDSGRTTIYGVHTDVLEINLGTPTKWWDPVVVQLDLPQIDCRVPSDPRNFGIRILEALVR